MLEDYGFDQAFLDLNELGFGDINAEERGKAHKRLAEFMLELETQAAAVEEAVK